MHPTHRTAAVSLALVVALSGCAQPSGDREASASSADRVEDTRSDTPEAAAPTAEEVAAAFAPHADAHASDGDAHGSHSAEEAVRTFPDGIVPTRVTIPAIGVDAEVTDLSLAGPQPEVPEDFDQVGWYVQTREPGEIGPAVLAGHVDSREGPAVFVDLGNLEPGDLISVTDDTGDERRFVVDALGQYPKDDLPPEVLGFGEPTPQLRLITCGGSFDRSTGHYRDNVVVYATLTDA